MDRHYKHWPSTDHRAKYRTDRLTHFRDPMIEIKKTSAAKLKSSQKLSFPGGLKKQQSTHLWPKDFFHHSAASFFVIR